jgi:cytochrome c553
MGGFAKALSKQDIENLSAYFASQKSALAAKY